MGQHDDGPELVSAPSSLAELFSGPVTAVEVRLSPGERARGEDAQGLDETLLWPEEEAALGGPVAPGRRRDFVLGRRCARLAMAQLGVEPAPVLRGPKREPLWPDGLVGAITHTAGYAAAVVARHAELAAVGVDAEPDEPLPAGVLDRVARPEDLAWVISGADGGGSLGVANPDRLLFTIKETVYKVWFPLAQRWLGFSDATVEIDPLEQRFVATILIDGPLRSVSGRYASSGGVLLAGAEVPAGPRDPARPFDQGP